MKTITKRTYKKLGFTGMETVEIVKRLNLLLANYTVHYQKMRHFHWNVRGRDFFDLHDKFEELYNEAKLNIDDIAERVRVFGQAPVGTMARYLEMSEITETEEKLSGEKMVKETLNDLQTLVSFMVDVTDAAIDIGDVGTEDMMNSFINRMETTHWMLTAWMNQS